MLRVFHKTMTEFLSWLGRRGSMMLALGVFLGLLVPPNDRDALVKSVQRVVADEALRQRLAAAGLARAREVAFEPQARAVAKFLAG